MKIFLVAGKAQSGKDFVGKKIQNYYDQFDQKSVITRFSKYVKLYAKEMTDWNGLEEEKPRKFLQQMGTFIREKMDNPYFFIKRMIEDIEIYSNFFDNVIITDVRLPDEIEQIKKLYKDAVVIYVKNEKENNLKPKEKEHFTEIALDDYEDFDYIIYNNGQDLDEKIENILGSIE